MPPWLSYRLDGRQDQQAILASQPRRISVANTDAPHTSWRPGRHIDRGIEMPKVGNVHYPYTAAGKKAAVAARKKKKKTRPKPKRK